jgi:hypothetical protein
MLSNYCLHGGYIRPLPNRLFESSATTYLLLRSSSARRILPGRDTITDTQKGVRLDIPGMDVLDRIELLLILGMLALLFLIRYQGSPSSGA